MTSQMVQELLHWHIHKYAHRPTDTTQNNTTAATLSLHGW